MADDDTTAIADTPAKPARRRRTTTPAKAAAAKPRATRTKAVTTDSDTPAAPKTPKAKAPPKPRSSKRAAPATPATKARVAATRTRAAAKTATDKVGGKWGAAAIATGIAAAGAAAALFTLKSSSAKPADPAKGSGPKTPTKGAHQPDGTDSSKSFEAGIADENTVPN